VVGDERDRLGVIELQAARLPPSRELGRIRDQQPFLFMRRQSHRVRSSQMADRVVVVDGSGDILPRRGGLGSPTATGFAGDREISTPAVRP
jgi:hypothetical protein